MADPEEAQAQLQQRLCFLVDMDNTLIDNDAAKATIDQQVRTLLGPAETERFWAIYEAIRSETSVVSYPLTLARFTAEASIGAGRNRDRNLARWHARALADLIMDFPYQEYIYRGAVDAIAHLRRLGRVAILSDGDRAYQPLKISRSGLHAAVAGLVLVYDHKEAHLGELRACFQADHYVLVDDKPTVLTNVGKARDQLGAPLTTVLVKQGKYAAQAGAGDWAGADLTLDAIGELRRYDAQDFLNVAGRAPATQTA